MEIQKNVADPKPINTKYPFAGMKKNDAFELEDQTEEGAKRARNAANLFRTRNRPTWSFSVRMHDDNLYRCKRVK